MNWRPDEWINPFHCMDRLLSEQEIDAVGEEYIKLDCCNELFLNRGHWERIAPHVAAAQLAKTDKEWVEWAKQPCPHVDWGSRLAKVIKRECPVCWQERKKEIGI